MIGIVKLLQAVAQSAQEAGPPISPAGPGGPEPAFSTIKVFTELVQFVGYFLAVGAVGFRFGVVRRARGMSDEARAILRADNAAVLGIFGVLLLVVATLSGPFLQSVTQHKTFAASLPKNLGPFEFKLAMLTLALGGFTLIRATPSLGWALAGLGVLLTVLQPLYAGKIANKVNAVHVLAASTWLGTLLVLTVIGIRGVIKSSSAGG